MADITYTVNQDNPENISGFEQFSQADTQLVNKFEINSLFIPTKNYIELHILDLVDEILPGCRHDCRNSFAFPKELYDDTIIQKINNHIGRNILIIPP